jgi:hypothetical protein
VLHDDVELERWLESFELLLYLAVTPPDPDYAITVIGRYRGPMHALHVRLYDYGDGDPVAR